VLGLNSCIIHDLLFGRAVLCWKVESRLNKLKNSCKRLGLVWLVILWLILGKNSSDETDSRWEKWGIWW